MFGKICLGWGSYVGSYVWAISRAGNSASCTNNHLLLAGLAIKLHIINNKICPFRTNNNAQKRTWHIIRARCFIDWMNKLYMSVCWGDSISSFASYHFRISAGSVLMGLVCKPILGWNNFVSIGIHLQWRNTQ